MLSFGDLRHEAGCNAGAGEAELAGVLSDRQHLHNFSPKWNLDTHETLRPRHDTGTMMTAMM
jgi:hypothetical protein